MSRPVPRLEVERGPWLLRAPLPDHTTHRRVHGELPTLSLEQLLALTEDATVRGRGGAGFPFARKLRAAVRRGRRHVVVNLSEGEPASAKDLALLLASPHLVLDGAVLTARALRVRTVQLVLPAERPEARGAVEQALRERATLDRVCRIRWQIHLAADRFVSGEASAVTELVAGRTGLPVTSWEPTAVSGVNGRPTLLSNAETFAHVGALALHGPEAYAARGTTEEPGTTLLTISRTSPGLHDGLQDGLHPDRSRVIEVDHGTPWSAVLDAGDLDAPVLLGGYHGTWAAAGALRRLTVSRSALAGEGLALGAGVVLPLPTGCPLERTALVLRYLAGESAGRCGPCFNGLPALATAFEDRLAHRGGHDVERLAGLVTGRGACAHPDGSVRMLASALRAFPAELAAHDDGRCASRRTRQVVR